MNTLILPVSGRSSRFPNQRPKWLLCHPKGKLMLIEAIKGLPLKDFDRVVIVALKEHQELYTFMDFLLKELSELVTNVEVLLLEKDTKNQPETIYEAIKQLNIRGSIYIKDCDNFFRLDAIPTYNSISTINLNTVPEVKAENKSYIKLGVNNTVANIAEKKLISDTFCCGGYFFANSEDFVTYYEQLQEKDNLYISHMIYSMILDNIVFFTNDCSEYLDWGTLEDWRKYCSTFKTLFIDIDGVLFENASPYKKPLWGESEPIAKNIQTLKKLYETGKYQIFLTTARRKTYSNDGHFDYEKTIAQLEFLGIPYDDIIWNCQHSQRILINDFAGTNPYPTAVAINLERNSDSLEKYLTQSN
jgi:hypothetical protein